MLQRVKDSERLWDELERLVASRSLPDRTIPVLFDAAIRFRVRNATYRAQFEDEITDQTASRDLRMLVERGLLAPHGEKRGRYYTASEELAAIRERIVDARDPRDDSDPFSAEYDASAPSQHPSLFETAQE